MEANSKNPDQTAQTSLKGSFCVHIVYNSRLECRRHKTGIGLNPLIQREREREREREGEGEREREREGERERDVLVRQPALTALDVTGRLNVFCGFYIF